MGARFSRRRSVVSLDRAQTGDVASRDAAGGSIYNGANADAVVGEALGIVRDAFLDEQKREIRQAQVDAVLADLSQQAARLAAQNAALRALALVDLALAIVAIGVCVAILIELR